MTIEEQINCDEEISKWRELAIRSQQSVITLLRRVEDAEDKILKLEASLVSNNVK